MTPGTQVKLMRVLQERCVQRLGGKETIPVDVRVIRRHPSRLETAIQHKQFREDLYYRLSVVVITLPPLRDRKEDILTSSNTSCANMPRVGRRRPVHPCRRD